MISHIQRASRMVSVALALAATILPAAVLAQPTPSYAFHQNTIKGTISHFDGQYTMYVNDDRGYTDRVLLHQGTVINPTGIRLDNGFRVTVIGYPRGNVFIANEIDTPYHRYYAYPVYYGPAIGFGWGWGHGWGWGRFHHWR